MMTRTPAHRFGLPPVWRVGLIILVIVVLAVLIALQDVKAAGATNHPDPAPTPPATIDVSWLIPGYTGDVAPDAGDPAIWIPEQTLYTTESCGVLWIQDDTWKYSTPEQVALADSIIAKGTLGRVNGVPEDSSLYISHEYRQQEPCIQPPAEETPGSRKEVNCEADTVTTHTWVDVVRYEGDASGWTAMPSVREREASSTGPADDVDCPPVVFVPPAHLADAGDEGWIILGIAIIVAVFGIWAIVWRRRALRALLARPRRVVHPDFGSRVRPAEYLPFSLGSLERLPVTLGAPAPMSALRHVAVAADPDAWDHVGPKDR